MAMMKMPREWYFLRKIRNHERPESKDRYEVQLLDNDGLAVAVGYFSDSEKEVVLSGKKIPPLVLQAALLKNEGKGDYVDENGKSLPPF